MMMHLSSPHFFGHLCANMGTFLRNVNYLPPRFPTYTFAEGQKETTSRGLDIFMYSTMQKFDKQYSTIFLGQK